MKKRNEAFTLMELMIIVVIMLLVTIGLYAPYNYYGNIAKVKVSRDIITQNINQAKNTSAGLVDSNTKKNQNIALYINKGANEIEFVAYPFDYTGSLAMTSTSNILKKIKLENDVYINSIENSAGTEYDNVIFLFKAPNGDMEQYISNSSTGKISKIVIGLKDATSGNLSKIIDIK